MDAKHIVSLRIGGVWYQTPAIYSQAEFEALMELIGWDVPFDMKIYHFHNNENERNPIMKERPVVDLDIERLLKAKQSQPHTYLDTLRNRPLKVQNEFDQHIIAYSPETGFLYFINKNDERYRRVAQYNLIPISLREAREFVDEHHRHNSGVKWHKFSVALEADGEIVGVAIASTPKSPAYDSTTLELNRVCTKSGFQNACSKLISTVVNIGKKMGYKTFITYTLMDEDGASFRAAGFEFDGFTENSKGWDNPSRPRKMPERYPVGIKKRWIYRI